MSTGSSRWLVFMGLSASISALDHQLPIDARSAARTTCPPSPWAAAAKNSPMVTPRATAIFSIELIDGETCPFSTWDMKLAEKSVCLASSRRDKPSSVRRRRTWVPTACCLRRELIRI